jgi:hypothetical protein
VFQPKNNVQKAGLPWKIVGIIVPLCFLVAGIFFTYRNIDLISNSGKADATITEVTRSGFRLRYQIANGQTYEIWRNGRVGTPQRGDIFPVYYRLNNPGEIVGDNFIELWFLPGVFGSVGLVCLIASVSYFANSTRS